MQGCKIERRNTSKRGNEPCPIPARPKGALGQEMWRILMKPFSLPEQWPGNVCVAGRGKCLASCQVNALTSLTTFDSFTQL